MTESVAHERGSWMRTAAILVIAAIPRTWAAVSDQGIFWPDEIFQSLEPAHGFAFGYGYVSWEFQDGARSWLFPGLLGLYWTVLAGFGVTSAQVLVIAAKLVMVALALAGIYASMRIAERLSGTDAAVLAGALNAAFPPSLVYGSRCMTEMASAAVITVAVSWLLDRRRWIAALAGCGAGLAIFLRYQNGIVAAALLGWLVAQRRGTDALAYGAAAALTALAGGMFDLVTWGAPFHSLRTYVEFNLIAGRSAAFGVEPATYYLTTLWTAVGPALLAIAIGLAASARRAPGLVVVALAYVGAHTLVGHKELRFLMPVVPLLLALSGVGLATIIEHFAAGTRRPAREGKGSANRRRPREDRSARRLTERATPAGRAPIWVLAAVLAAAMFWRAAYATFDDFGQHTGPLSGPHSVWHRMEPVNRLLWAAGTQPDLCALALVGFGPIWTGGYAYLHRDVPILWIEPIDSESANYVLARGDIPLPEAYVTVETVGDARLARRSGACGPPPASYTRLFPRE